MTTNNNPRAIGGTIGGGRMLLRRTPQKLRSLAAHCYRVLAYAAIRAQFPNRDPALEAILTLRRAIRSAPTARALRPIAKEANLLGMEVRSRRAELRRAA